MDDCADIFSHNLAIWGDDDSNDADDSDDTDDETKGVTYGTV